MNSYEKKLIDEGIIDSPLTDFIISKWYDKVTLEFNNNIHIIRVEFVNCFEIKFKHDLKYFEGEKEHHYFMQDVDIKKTDDFFNIKLSAYPFNGEIICKKIEIIKE
ncbi:hypothetical protein LC087_17720 [Bacillus carboniphilus]|uniref:Uncharacterized protein n=1 Tax=Bacillus carboniphilus TaxID=86663 RepID=A0ABY9JVI0_9BACI|nr:hypothetical protein [Bacillus carboniphilus]WLR42508.1 hypothetical protein LC087_17720 [Bacillus carboniphilus]